MLFYPYSTVSSNAFLFSHLHSGMVGTRVYALPFGDGMRQTAVRKTKEGTVTRSSFRFLEFLIVSAIFFLLLILFFFKDSYMGKQP